MNNNKGCINWLEQEFLKLESTVGVLGVFYELLEQAKVIEKEQRISDYYQGADDESVNHGAGYISRKDAERWYNKTQGGNK